jgi:hypothetical protein
VTGMFGDFAAADAFHEAVTQAHTHRTLKLRAHQQTDFGFVSNPPSVPPLAPGTAIPS